uniref:Putative salivary secreted peptide n=1 Tax=Glossina morsitans morsitans TaxID=37546 RepID=D3TS41_GLOMM
MNFYKIVAFFVVVIFFNIVVVSAYPNPSLWDYLGEGFGGGLTEDLKE